MQRQLDSPDAMQVLPQALAPIVGQPPVRGRPGENVSFPRGETIPHACAHGAPGNAATLGASVHTGQSTPNAGYSGAQAGLFTPNAGYMNPQMGHSPPTGFPYIPFHLPQTVGSFPQNLSQAMPYPSMLQPGLDAPRPSTSSSASMPSHDDTVSAFLSHAEDREFRDSDTETESEEEGEVEVRPKFRLSPQSASMLAEVVSKPLKNTKRRQVLERFPPPAECDPHH